MSEPTTTPVPEHVLAAARAVLSGAGRPDDFDVLAGYTADPWLTPVMQACEVMRIYANAGGGA